MKTPKSRFGLVMGFIHASSVYFPPQHFILYWILEYQETLWIKSILMGLSVLVKFNWSPNANRIMKAMKDTFFFGPSLGMVRIFIYISRFFQQERLLSGRLAGPFFNGFTIILRYPAMPSYLTSGSWTQWSGTLSIVINYQTDFVANKCDTVWFEYQF